MCVFTTLISKNFIIIFIINIQICFIWVLYLYIEFILKTKLFHIHSSNSKMDTKELLLKSIAEQETVSASKITIVGIGAVGNLLLF